MIRTGGFVLERREPREYDVSGPGSGSSRSSPARA